MRGARSHPILLISVLPLVLGMGCRARSEGTAAGATGSATIDPDRWPVVSSPLATDPELERRVEELLARMTLEEKVGQVIQAEIQHVTPADVREYNLGS
ncbi:MAG TPA: 1,4-beta-D-glucan glucohydrolase, partial [Thermoanaerobaculia bacterium]|nr:1,4-beta-D-glucan glucohydrolase [Thermoanaerobaculia bacterium]